MTDNKTDIDQNSEDAIAVAVDTETEIDETEIDETEIDETEIDDAEIDDAEIDDADADSGADDKHRINWPRVLAYGILPGLALVLAMAAGYLKWQDNSVRDNNAAAAASVQVAKDSTIKMLSYRPDKVEQQLTAARALLTGKFRDSYTALVNDVVIPGAKQKQVTAVAKVPVAASVSADSRHAVALVFVNQTVTVGTDVPTETASSVRVTLEKVGDQWLISSFEPI